MTEKPKGLAKIWREVKRPFRKRVSQLPNDQKIEIFRQVMASPELCEQIYEEELAKHKKGEFSMPFHLINFWGVVEKSNLDVCTKKERLISGIDELSRETIDRFLNVCNPTAEMILPMPYPAFRQIFHTRWPLYIAECDRLEHLEKQYKNKGKYRINNEEMYTSCQAAVGFGMGNFHNGVECQVVDKDVIDGGGCSGDSAMILSEYGSRHVYSFEPNPESIAVMQKVLDENTTALGERRQKISSVPFAIGKARGKIKFHTTGALDGSATVRDVGHGTKTCECNVVSIDDYVCENNLNVGLIKLDIEGAEYDAICGAMETIRQQKPLLIISIYHTAKDFFEIKPLIESLNVGYKFFVRHLHVQGPVQEYCLFGYVDSNNNSGELS